MALDLQTFYKRLGSSVVFVVVMLCGLLWNDWAFLALVCLINILCIGDYCRLMQKIDKHVFWPESLPYIVQFIGLVIIVPVFFLNHSFFLSFKIWLAMCIVPAMLLLIGVLSKKNFLAALTQSFGGILYITLPMIMLLFIRQQNFIFPLALILMIWANDTLAYLVGSFIGKHPFSRVSPNKTWEGTIGGALLTIAGAIIYGGYAQKYSWIDWTILALCATVAGTLGDLLESKLKRLADVKDSGKMMPGHGGALDRFDSLLIATPFAFVYIICFMWLK